jgi:predicted nucleic acid-binding protein
LEGRGAAVRRLWVVDCSAAMSLLMPDENGTTMETLLKEALTDSVLLLVPPLFWYEVTNVLRMAEKRNRLTGGEANALLYRLTELPFETAPSPTPAILIRIHRLAGEYGLTSYDATYLECAESAGANLLTGDRGILSAARDLPWVRPLRP